MHYTTVLPLVFLAARSVVAVTPLDIVSSLILALPVSPICTSSAACSGLASVAPPCYAPALIGNATAQAQCACTVAFVQAMESCALCLAQDPCYITSPRNGPLIAVQLFQTTCQPTNSAVQGVTLTNVANVGPGVCGQTNTGQTNIVTGVSSSATQAPSSTPVVSTTVKPATTSSTPIVIKLPSTTTVATSVATSVSISRASNATTTAKISTGTTGTAIVNATKASSTLVKASTSITTIGGSTTSAVISKPTVTLIAGASRIAGVSMLAGLVAAVALVC